MAWTKTQNLLKTLKFMATTMKLLRLANTLKLIQKLLLPLLELGQLGHLRNQILIDLSERRLHGFFLFVATQVGLDGQDFPDVIAEPGQFAIGTIIGAVGTATVRMSVPASPKEV